MKLFKTMLVCFLMLSLNVSASQNQQACAGCLLGLVGASIMITAYNSYEINQTLSSFQTNVQTSQTLLHQDLQTLIAQLNASATTQQFLQDAPKRISMPDESTYKYPKLQQLKIQRATDKKRN